MRVYHLGLPDLLFSGGSAVLAVAKTWLPESEAYNSTRLAPRPRVAPTMRTTGMVVEVWYLGSGKIVVLMSTICSDVGDEVAYLMLHD
jgi:hypothetical protein